MFSELVDEVVARTIRPDRLTDHADCANQTIRELSSRAYFFKNLVEDTIEADSDPYIWTRPIRIQRLRTIQYSDGSFPDFIQPGRKQQNQDSYYYGAATYYVLKGVLFSASAGSGSFNVAYYQFPKNLKYYADVADRPAVYDKTTEEWTYNAAYDTDDVARSVARALVSNWLLADWYDLVKEGTSAKIFKIVNDETRASTHFSFFERTIAQSYLTSELHESFNL